MKNLFIPFKNVDSKTYMIIGLFHFAWIFAFLQLFSTSLIPAPIDVLFSLKKFLLSKDFYENFATTFLFTLKGVGIATLISLPISYLFFMSFFKQLSLLSTKLRYLSMAGIAFVFTILFKVDTDIKMSLILFGIIPFFVTSLIASFSDNINEKLDLCRVNRFNNFETLKEVVIIGKLDQVFEIIRQNFAICWIVITFAETKCMGQGGLGTLLLKNEKTIRMEDVFAIQLVVLFTGVLFDQFFQIIRYVVFEYAYLASKKKIWIVDLFNKTKKK